MLEILCDLPINIETPESQRSDVRSATTQGSDPV